MRHNPTNVFIVLCAFLMYCSTIQCRNNKHTNVVIFFLDDSGWGDFSPFGNTEYPTPNVQKMANEGCRYTSFYVPQAVCSASRAALLTGCNPGRTKVFGAHRPRERGLDPKFTTMGQMFQSAGYRTAFFGKWHVGDQPDTHPAARGFDESAGLMYSNDMWEYNTANPSYWGQWALKYWHNNEVTIEQMTPEYQKQMTTWTKEQSVDFIDRHQDSAFFMYIPFSMPHIPLYCSDKFLGKSGQGIYADVMMELDWAMGEVMNKIKETGNEKNTIVVFTSDNGPWTLYGKHGGTTPFRGAKRTSFDGGIKSACIIKYPKKIKKNSVVDKAFFSIDIMPTLASMTGVSLPSNVIDGLDVSDIVKGKKRAVNPHLYYPISTGNQFESIISGDGKWKLHLAHDYKQVVERGIDGHRGTKKEGKISLSLFDLKNDPYEEHDVSADNPIILEQLLEIAEQHRLEFYSK